MKRTPMTRTTKWVLSAALAAAVVLASAGIVLGGGNGDSDTPLAGTAQVKAQAAALAETGGGTVVDSEVGDGGAAYTVQIRTPDGILVEVSLDAGFNVIGTEADQGGPDDTGSDN